MKKTLLFFLIFIVFKAWAQDPCPGAGWQINGPSELCINDVGAYSITAPVGTTFTVVWDFGDGSTANTSSVSHVFTTTGLRVVKANVSTSNGLSCFKTVFTNIADPEISSVISCAGKTTKLEISRHFSATSGASGTINFGDGTSATITNQVLTHVYANAGTYTITANVAVTPQGFESSLCTRTINNTVKIPSCTIFGCENRDLETGDFTRWNTTTSLDPCPFAPVNCFLEGPRNNEHTIVSGTGVDPYGGFPVVASGGTYSMKIGNNLKTDRNLITANYNTLLVTAENAIMAYRIAAVIEDVENFSSLTDRRPSIRLEIIEGGESTVPCSKVILSRDFDPGFTKVSGQNVYYLPWTTYYFDLTPFIGKEIDLSLEVSKGLHVKADETIDNIFAYAYFDSYCTPLSIQSSSSKCMGSPIQFFTNFDSSVPGEAITWDMGEGTILNDGKNISHTYRTPGTYTVTMKYDPHFAALPNGPVDAASCGVFTVSQTVSVSECAPPFVCETCIPAFSPLPGERYLLIAWVKEDDGIGSHTYEHPSIRVNFEQCTITDHFRPTGLIIDGWQRIEGKFIVPMDAEKVSIELHNDDNDKEVFFDDIRIQPFNASMKSYVYDPVTLRLVAELDERNFSTFYEYDEEGSLTRIKKETERGVKTLRETRESLKKRGQ